jgi:DDE superfamily endonuclease
VEGLLIWIQKPNQTTVQETKVGQTNYFCGRKNKYGLNLQGTCNHKRRFIDIDIRHPAATSDYLAFETSALNKKLEQDGFLYNKLAIYGDCAYVNSPYMATPIKGV